MFQFGVRRSTTSPTQLTSAARSRSARTSCTCATIQTASSTTSAENTSSPARALEHGCRNRKRFLNVAVSWIPVQSRSVTSVQRFLFFLTDKQCPILDAPSTLLRSTDDRLLFTTVQLTCAPTYSIPDSIQTWTSTYCHRNQSWSAPTPPCSSALTCMSCTSAYECLL